MRRVLGSAGLRLSRCWMRPARRAPRWSAERRARPKRGRMATFVRVARAGPRRARRIECAPCGAPPPSFIGACWKGFVEACSKPRMRMHRENEIACPSPQQVHNRLVREGNRARRCLTLWTLINPRESGGGWHRRPPAAVLGRYADAKHRLCRRVVEGASDSTLRCRRRMIVESDAPSTAQSRGPPSPQRGPHRARAVGRPARGRTDLLTSATTPVRSNPR